jgi:hypothetical protein
MVEEYDPFLDGTNGICGCPKLNTSALVKLGLKPDGTMQAVADAIILPVEYMNPYESTTGRMHKTTNTVSVHWYAGTWLTPWQRIRSTISKPLHRVFGDNCFAALKLRRK